MPHSRHEIMRPPTRPSEQRSPTVKPQPPALEQWDDWGVPTERIAADDERWRFSGDWAEHKMGGRTQTPVRRADRWGSEAEVSFRGTGVILSGPFLPTGGQAEVFLDGESMGRVDSYQDGHKNAKRSESLWHRFRLPPGEHTLKLVVLDEPMFDSPGSDVSIESLIVFEAR